MIHNSLNFIEIKKLLIYCDNVTISGPEISGARPVLVTFETFKDREEVLRKGNLNKERKNKLQNVEIIFTYTLNLEQFLRTFFHLPPEQQHSHQ